MALIPRPFDTLQALQQALDAYRTSGWLETGVSGGGAYPPINAFRQGEDIVLIAEVPGVRKADLDVQVKGRTVRISGSRSIGYPQGASVHRRERSAGRFDRAIALPFEIDADGIKAEARDGLLALKLSRHERERPRKIEVS